MSTQHGGHPVPAQRRETKQEPRAPELAAHQPLRGQPGRGRGPAARLENCQRVRFQCVGSPAPEQVVRPPLTPGSLKP